MKILKLLAIVVLVGSLVACGTAPADESSKEDNKEVVNGSGDSSSTETEGKAVVVKEEGAYVGQIDSNSIEVNTESETLVLQVGKITDVDFGSIDQNAHVTIEYYKNKEGQAILQSIQVTEVNEDQSTQKELIKEEASYVGQVDSTSIEVNTEMNKMTLLTEQVKDVDWGKIEKNAHVVVEYYKNDKGQYVLTSIETK